MGRLFVVSGPAGAGKGTILGRVREQRPDLALSVSATTRAPRVGTTSSPRRSSVVASTPATSSSGPTFTAISTARW